jgi:2-oxoisovalerate dehydrogenase E1 component beta subunit
MPSNPLDAYGLMLSAIEDPNPVLFLKPKALMRVKGTELIPGEPSEEKDLKAMIDAPIGERSDWKPRWPKLDESYRVPIGKAKICCDGDALTVVSYGRMLPLCVKAASEMREEGVGVEVIDMRSLYPYDWQTIKNSILKTRRVLFVNEDTEVTNFGEHLSYRVTQELFYDILARPRVLAGKNIPGVGLHPNYEEATVPYYPQIINEIREVLAEAP